MAEQGRLNADSGSDLEEVKQMLAALTRSQAQNVSDLRDELRRSAHEQARSVSELHVALRDGLAETVVVARQVAVEHCDRLREKVEEQLREVKEETAERVDVLREEMSELRAAVQQQAASQPWAEQAAGGEERPAPLVKKDDQWGTQSEPGDVRAWVAAGYGWESRAPLTAPGAPTWVPYHPSQPAPHHATPHSVSTAVGLWRPASHRATPHVASTAAGLWRPASVVSLGRGRCLRPQETSRV